MSSDTNQMGKVILIGSSGVGKTSLITYYLTNTFTQQELSTVAPASCSATVKIGDKSVDLQIWDTAGQEKFLSISQMFYRDADIAFVCFTSESKDSIEKWVERIRQQSPNCTIFLVLTKSDLLSPEETSQLHEYTLKVKDKIEASCVVITSSATGNGVSDLFELAATEILNAASPKETKKVVELQNSNTEDGGKKCC